MPPAYDAMAVGSQARANKYFLSCSWQSTIALRSIVNRTRALVGGLGRLRGGRPWHPIHMLTNRYVPLTRHP